MGAGPRLAARMPVSHGRAGERILELVRWQVALGPRVPGSQAHEQLREYLVETLRPRTKQLVQDEFHVYLDGRRIDCANVIGVVEARQPATRGPILVGTHYDTRPVADRDADASLRRRPIPGANDGGSGTAVLLHLLDRLREAPLSRDVIVVFFDAEDLGNLSGNEFSMGARHLAECPPRELPVPDEVVALDMVGGRGMSLDIDAHALRHARSFDLTMRVFSLGRKLGAEPFVREKPNRYKYIITDHWPFMQRGVPSCILIDIDYPEWHTHRDLPEALSAHSLEAIEEVLALYLMQPPP